MTSVAFTTGYQFVKLVIEPPANKMPDSDSSSHVSLYGIWKLCSCTDESLLVKRKLLSGLKSSNVGKAGIGEFMNIYLYPRNVKTPQICFTL